MVKSIHDWLQIASTKLVEVGVASARLDCLVLLSDELGRDKAWVLTHDDTPLKATQLTALEQNLARRLQHEPLAYIRGYSEFYGHKFAVSPDVLVPRPESESLIELLKLQTKDRRPKTIIDVGTGSGCLAISAKLELPSVNVIALDISKKALNIAAKNATSLNAEINFIQSNLLDALYDVDYRQPTVLIANLPYVPENYPINQAAKHEPTLALFSGDDGLDHYRQLFAQTTVLSSQPAAIITESLLTQHKDILEMAKKYGYQLQNSLGLAQYFQPIAPRS